MKETKSGNYSLDPVTLEVLRNSFAMVAEEMSANLVRTSYSPNIKERRDSSCALFDRKGKLIAQAENIPVHLGAMPRAVNAVLDEFDPARLEPGSAVIHNDPYEGGVHLPDITMVSPVHHRESLIGFVANRAHHADVGGSSPGSLSADSKSIYAEGLQIPPVRLVREGEMCDEVMRFVLANMRAPAEREGDLRAQLAANYTGEKRFRELIAEHGKEKITAAFADVLNYSEKRTRSRIRNLPDGSYGAVDFLDDDGCGTTDIRVEVRVEVKDDVVSVDFAGTHDQVEGPVNAPIAVTESATYYSLRAATDPSIPPNSGCYRPISIEVPEKSLLNPVKPASVVGGNLETSQRIVDVILAALAGAGIGSIPAGSNGSMNNVTFGGGGKKSSADYTFYETIGGGSGGCPGKDGVDGIHCHMTNTRNTPVEVIERNYPLRVEKYGFRRDSGGAGKYRGGLGLVREIRALEDGTEFSLLSDRRTHRPRGFSGGKPGQSGKDVLIRNKEKRPLPAKVTKELRQGDLVCLRTPGGGGYGDPRERQPERIARDLREDRVSRERVKNNYPQYESFQG